MKNLIVGLLLCFGVIAGCASSSMLSIGQVVAKTGVLVEAQDVRLDKPSELRARTDAIYQAMLYLVFAGVIDPAKDLEPFMEVDSVEYYVSVAYVRLLSGDDEGYAAAIAEAEGIVERAESNVKAVIKHFEDAEIKKNSI